MDKKNLGKTMRIAMLVVMLLVLQAAVTSSCSGNGEGSLKGVGAVIENTRTIAEGFYAFKPPVTYDILDIEVDKSGVLYIAEKDKVLRIDSKKQGHEEPVTGLGYCQNILAANERILLVDQSDEKKMLKIYNTKGTLLGNFEIEAFRIIKMQSLDDKGKTIALLIHDEDRNNKIILLDTENGEITSLDYTNVRLFCTFGKDKICVITPGSPYTLEIYDTANDKVINSVNLSTGVFPDIAYNEKSKTLYCLSSSDIGSEIGTIDLETGTVRTLRQLDTANMKRYSRMEIHDDLVYFLETENDELYCLDLKSPAAQVGVSKSLKIGFTWGTVDSYDLREAQAVFVNKNPEVQVYYTSFSMDSPISKTKLMAGEELDIVSVYSFFLHDFIASNAIADLSGFDDLVSAMKHEDVLDGLYDFSSIDGFLFGIPVHFYPHALLVNSELRKELNIELPDQNWTWQDFYKYAKKVRQDLNGNGKKDTYIMRVDKNYPLFLESCLCEYISKVTGKVDFNSESFISLLKLWKKMCDEDLIGPGSFGSRGKLDDTILFSLDSAGNNMGSKEYTYLPALNSKKKVYPAEVVFLCVSSTSKNTELAVEFLKIYLSREVQEAMVYTNISYICKDFSIYKKRLEELNSLEPLNAINEQIYKNVLKYAVPMSYPADLRIFITHEVMPEFMSGKITAEEVAKQIQEKAEMMVRE